MIRTPLSAALSLAFSLAIISLAPAQEAAGKADAKPELKKEEVKKEEPKKEEPKKDPKVADYEKVVKDLKRIDGPFALYMRKKDILLELPESKLGAIFLVQTTLNTGLNAGLLQAGIPVGNNLFTDFNSVDPYKFERSDETVNLIRPNVAYRWDANDPMALGAARSFPDALLASYRIEQTNPEKKLLLINVSSLFNGDVTRINEIVAQMLGGPYALDRDKVSVDSAKGFPENTIVRMKLYYAAQRGAPGGMASLFADPNQLEDGRSAPLKVTYNIWFRKEDGYVPRLADPRVGYFTNDFFSFDKYTDLDRTQRYVIRWNLKKKDPKAALSEPVKPIVWTIDNSIPPQWRQPVKDGILFWNKAFEQVGFKNAVQVQDQPNDPDYDHADGRYNVIRFGASDEPSYGAIALARTDPFTGEIYNAGIIVDASMVQFRYNDYLRSILPGSFARSRRTEVFIRQAAATMPTDQYLFQTEAEAAREAAESRLEKMGIHRNDCRHADSLALEAAYGFAASQMSPGVKISKEEFFRRYLRDTVAHEVGHTFGLRHNFAGSTNLTTKELADDSVTNQVGIAASVMEYSPINVQAVLKGNGNFFMTTVGPYDVWAIRYGYTDTGAKTPLGEKFALSKVASESALPGHAFLTDEDADSWNPLAVRGDGAKDTLNFARGVMVASKRASQYAIAELPLPGEDYARRTELLLLSQNRAFNQGRIAARFVGGVEGRRNFRGDQGEKPTLSPVPASEQRDAIKLITENLFSANSFALPPEVLNRMSMSAENNWMTPAPLRDIIGGNQQGLLALLMSASTTDRIAENAYRNSGKDAYGIDEHYRTLMSAVFSEVGTGATITPLRRDLQRFALTGLTIQAGAPQGAVNDDVRAVTGEGLRVLNERISRAMRAAPPKDAMTRIHLRDMQETIRRFEARQVIAR